MIAAQAPLVSVVTASLNQAPFLEEMIRSVAQQDYPRLEHVVADGASTDGSVEILRGHDHLRWWSREDAGQSAALNEAFRATSGEIIGWLNADDLYLPGAVTAAVAAFGSNPRAGVVYGDAVVIDEAGHELQLMQPTQFDLDYELNVRNVIAQPAAFIRRSALEEVGFLDPDLHYAMDYDLWLRIARAGHELVYVPSRWAAFRLHPNSKTRAHGGRFWAEERTVMLRHGGRRISRRFVSYHRELAALRLRGRLRPFIPTPVLRAVRRREL